MLVKHLSPANLSKSTINKIFKHANFHLLQDPISVLIIRIITTRSVVIILMDESKT